MDADSQGERVDRFLAANFCHLSRSHIKKLIDDCQVWVDGKSVRAAYKIRAGQRIDVIEPKPVAAAPQPEQIPLCILYEDAQLIVIDKPAGLVVHPAPGSPDGTLVNALLHHCDDLSGIGGVERPGIVHRLDRNTSGLLVVSKNDQAHQSLSNQFAKHQVEKIYLAFGIRMKNASALPQKGKFETLYGRHPVHRKRFSSKVSRGKTALTLYEILEDYSAPNFDAFKAKVEIKTGRTHQIRVHFSDSGHPLLGDKLYGGRSYRFVPSELDMPRQALHAWKLAFDHPLSKKKLTFQAPLPADLVRLEKILRSLSRRIE